MVIEQNEVPFLPIMSVYQRRIDARPLQPVHDFSDSLQILDDFSILQMNLSHG